MWYVNGLTRVHLKKIKKLKIKIKKNLKKSLSDTWQIVNNLNG